MENVLLFPNVRITVRDEAAGIPIREIRTRNLFVDSGLVKLGDLFAYPNRSDDADDYGDGKTPAFCAVGTSGAMTTAGMTTLGAEVYRTKITRRHRHSKSILLYYYLSTSEANGNTLQEIGLFTEASGGLLWSRATHSAIVKTSSISVTYEWTHNFGAS